MAENKSHKLQNNNLMSIVILVVGIIAFLVVAYLAYQKISSPASNDGSAQNDISYFKESSGVNRAEGGAQPEKKTYKRQKAISEKEMSGLWEAKLKSGKALLEMDDGVYRLVIILSNSSNIRYYSNGNYKITNDLVMLSPNYKWGPPKGGDYNYRFLTSAKVPVVAAKYKGKMIWQVPSKDVDVYVPPYHAVLDYAEDKIMVWRVLK